MGKFDGILICSDWDGTLFDGKCVPKKSIEAIKYFQANGGKFTLCSGRAPFYMKKISELVKPNTYALAVNGTVICDLDTDVILKEGFVDRDAYRLAEEIINIGVEIKSVAACVKDMDDYIWMTPKEFFERKEALYEYPVYKITFTTERECDGDRLIEEIGKLDSGIYSVTRSSRGYIEMVLREGTKGRAALYLKELLGARLLVCMGDYENDVTMFECADVSYAPANAIDKIKNMATHVTASVSDCAVASVISDIEKRYL